MATTDTVSARQERLENEVELLKGELDLAECAIAFLGERHYGVGGAARAAQQCPALGGIMEENQTIRLTLVPLGHRGV